MPYIDFQAVKDAVPIDEAVRILGLKVVKSANQLRGPCPACKSGGERALAITPARNLYYCFAKEAGGDQIAMVAHILGISTKDAAEHLSEQAAGTRSVTSDRTSTVGKDRAEGFKALDYLDAAHPAVEAVGFDQATALALGVGYAPKGILRGTIAVPVRLEDGSIAGYIGITEAKLPNRWHLLETNVVKLKTA